MSLNSYLTSFNKAIKAFRTFDFVCFRIYRYDPSIDDAPWIQSWYVKDLQNQSMLLDSLFI